MGGSGNIIEIMKSKRNYKGSDHSIPSYKSKVLMFMPFLFKYVHIDQKHTDLIRDNVDRNDQNGLDEHIKCNYKYTMLIAEVIGFDSTLMKLLSEFKYKI